MVLPMFHRHCSVFVLSMCMYIYQKSVVNFSNELEYDDIELCFLRFDNVRIPRENLLNSVADVSPDGQYLSSIKDPDQVFTVTIRK